jgi:hypothetical protein
MVARVERATGTYWLTSVHIITPSPAVSTRKMPDQSQVAPWKKRCSPG